MAPSEHPLAWYQGQLQRMEHQNLLNLVKPYITNGHAVHYASEAEIQQIGRIISTASGREQNVVEPHSGRVENLTYAIDPSDSSKCYRWITSGCVEQCTLEHGNLTGKAIVVRYDLRNTIEAFLAEHHSQATTEASLCHRTAARYGINRARWVRENNRF
ncbi:hypothetical protein JCM10212_003489 [Sporobolomyces blumeae]